MDKFFLPPRSTEVINKNSTLEKKKEKKRLPKDCFCGQQPPPNEISGGQAAAPHEFPWIVRIVQGCAKGTRN